MQNIVIIFALLGLTACGSTTGQVQQKDAALNHTLASARTFAAQARAYERNFAAPDQASASQSYEEAAKLAASTGHPTATPLASRYFARSVITKIKSADGDPEGLKALGDRWAGFLKSQGHYAPTTLEERVAMALLYCRASVQPLVGMPAHLDFTGYCAK